MYSGNRRLIALRTFSAVNPRVILFLQKMAKSAQNFLLGDLPQKNYSGIYRRNFKSEHHRKSFPTLGLY